MKKENKKRVVSLALASILSLSGGFSIDKKGSNKHISYNPISVVDAATYDDIYVKVNSENLKFDVEPMMKNDRIFVPMRKIFEALWADVKYDEATDSINITSLEGDKLKHKIGTNKITKNGEILEFDVESFVEEGRTMVPARFIGESLGADVLFFSNDRFKECSVELVKVIKESNGNTNIANKLINNIESNPNFSKEEKEHVITNLTPMFNDLSRYISVCAASDIKTAKANYNVEIYKEFPEWTGALALVFGGDIYFNFSSFKEVKNNISHTFLHEFIHLMEINCRSGLNEGIDELLLREYLDNHSAGYTRERMITNIFIEAFGKEAVCYYVFNVIDLYKDKKYSDLIPEKFNRLSAEEIQKEYNKEFIEVMTKVYERRTGEKVEDNKLMMVYFDGIDYQDRLDLGISPRVILREPIIYDTNYRYYNNPSNDEDDIIVYTNSSDYRSIKSHNIGPKYKKEKNKSLQLSK